MHSTARCCSERTNPGRDQGQTLRQSTSRAAQSFDQAAGAKPRPESELPWSGHDLPVALPRARRALKFNDPPAVRGLAQGSRDQPFCKFSKAAVAALDATGAPYGTFDVFQVLPSRACLGPGGGVGGP